MINKIRKLLIHIGKVLPFVVCFLMCINYLETAFALATSDYLHYDGVVILNTPISFFIGQYFEYDLLVCIITLIISIAIEACKWNIWSTFYAFFHIAEKSYFDFELEPTTIYIICLANIIVAGYLTYKGIRIISRKQ